MKSGNRLYPLGQPPATTQIVIHRSKLHPSPDKGFLRAKVTLP